MKKTIYLTLGLFIFSMSLTVLYLAMRAVMGVGGACAEGGAYQIATHCPGGTAWLTPLSIFTGLAGVGLYFVGLTKKGPNWGTFFWSALFISLGWNFLDFSIHPPIGQGIEISWLVCAILFILMGGAPLFAFSRNEIVSHLIGPNEPIKTPDNNHSGPGATDKFYESDNFLRIIHIAVAAGGIYLGWLIYTST